MRWRAQGKEERKRPEAIRAEKDSPAYRNVPVPPVLRGEYPATSDPARKKPDRRLRRRRLLLGLEARARPRREQEKGAQKKGRKPKMIRATTRNRKKKKR